MKDSTDFIDNLAYQINNDGTFKKMLFVFL